MDILLDTWLRKINQKFREENIPPNQRPFMAIKEYSSLHNTYILFNSELASSIFEWFKNNSKAGIMEIGNRFTGAFYYDACFWRVSIPIIYGHIKVNCLDSLPEMPIGMKRELIEDVANMDEYCSILESCLNYSDKIDLLWKQYENSDQQWYLFFVNADRELNICITQLLDKQVNSKAILAARNAVEIYLKAFILRNKELTDKELRKIGHDLDEALLISKSFTKNGELDHFQELQSQYPRIDKRYDLEDISYRSLWDAYKLAQYIGERIASLLADS